MSRFQLVFRRDGESDQTEYRLNNGDGEPHLDGVLLIDGESNIIRDLEWSVRREDVGDTRRFVCTLVVEPTDS